MRSLSPRVVRALRYTFKKNKNERVQHGVNALDGGDADAADAVELRGLQVLDVVKLGELAAVVGRDELLVPRRRDQGLVAEVAAVVLVRLIFGFQHEARRIAEI